MLIALQTPNSPYKAFLDTEVMEVEIKKAFIGPKFVTEDGECLVVMMRDSGFELYYVDPGSEPINLRLNAGLIDKL